MLLVVVITSKKIPIGKLAFQNLSIESIKIPSQVTFIGEQAFSHCDKLVKIEFLNDSHLQEIGKDAFIFSSIESITIPSQVIRIKEGSFSECKRLKCIRIPNDSNLQIIEKDAFFGSSIENITIPSKSKELNEEWCRNVLNLSKIYVSPDYPLYTCFDEKFLLKKSSIEKTYYYSLCFCSRNIEIAIIPDFIEHICPYAFAD